MLVCPKSRTLYLYDMSFIHVISELRSQYRDDDASKAEALLAQLECDHCSSKIYANLDQDPQVPQALRFALVEHLLAYSPTMANSLLEFVVNFCHRPENGLRGEPREVAQARVLGHLRKKSKLEEDLNRDPRGAAAGRAGLNIDLILSSELAVQKLLLAGVQITRYNVWSWFDEEFESDPYFKVERRRDELARRLGLPHCLGAECVCWAHKLMSGQTARWPTAIDAANFPEYQHGGRTMPLSPNSTGIYDGLPEVVHEPIWVNDLSGRIERLN